MQEELDDPGRVALEIRKLRWELSFWARAAAVAVPIAAFVVAASQVAIAWWDTSSKERVEARDLSLKEIENGVNLVQFTTLQTERLLSTNLEQRSQALAYAATLLPAEQACKVINAVIIASPGHADFLAPAQEIREMLAQQVANSPAQKVCSDPAIFDMQNRIAVAVAQAAREVAAPPSQFASRTPSALPAAPAAPTATPPTATPPTAAPPTAQPVPLPPQPVPPPKAAVAPPATNAAPPVAAAPVPPTPATCQLPNDRSVLPLVVYYQIVQQKDRQDASRVGYQMPDIFPSAGVEFVRENDPKKQYPEVRFYYPEQEPAAAYLACLLTDAYLRVVGKQPSVGGREVSFRVDSLVGKYGKLPQKRVEVWFPAIATDGS